MMHLWNIGIKLKKYFAILMFSFLQLSLAHEVIKINTQCDAYLMSNIITYQLCLCNPPIFRTDLK